MLQLILWPIFAVWMLTGLVVAAVILSTLVWSTAHQLRDEAGINGDIWCPMLRQTMHVHGLPRRFTTGPEFCDLSRCQHWGKGPVRCAKACIAETEPAKAA